MAPVAHPAGAFFLPFSAVAHARRSFSEYAYSSFTDTDRTLPDNLRKTRLFPQTVSYQGTASQLAENALPIGLYQGTTSVVPFGQLRNSGFSVCVRTHFRNLRWENIVIFAHQLAPEG